MTEETNQVSYYSITPANVRYCKKLSEGAKLLYGEITALCNSKGYCWATNEYFAELYDNDSRTISRWISSLSNEDFIYVLVEKGRRKIFLTQKFDSSNLPQQDEPVEDKKPEKQKKVKKPAKQKKPKKDKKEKIAKYNDKDLVLAELLFSKIIYNHPTFENKKVNIKDWANDMRLLREVEKASPEQIFFMIYWIHGGTIEVPNKPPRIFEPHTFWSSNIMSAGKLRAQWLENLVPQLKTAVIKTEKKSTVAQL